jgi:hypothetical protein
MVRSLLIRGMLVGLAAGVLAFVFAYLFGEPQVQQAIDFEDALARSTGDPAGPEIVSRGVQRTLGLLAGTAALGVALGGGFSLVYAYVYGRVGAAGPRATAAVLAAAAFVTITLVPFTKYPANPPAASDAETIGQRTLLYVAMIAITVTALVAGSRVRSQLLARLGSWNASLVAGGVFIGLVAVAQLILPAIRETPQGFPADVLYRFRLASLGISAVLWLSIGLGFGAAAERLLSPRGRRVAVPAADAA